MKAVFVAHTGSVIGPRKILFGVTFDLCHSIIIEILKINACFNALYTNFAVNFGGLPTQHRADR